MSWSTSFKEPVRKIDADAFVERLGTGGNAEGPAIDQCEAAKRAVKALLPSIPGPYVMVSMSGHANGVGWQKKDGWANDCISVNITQMLESDLPKPQGS